MRNLLYRSLGQVSPAALSIAKTLPVSYTTEVLTEDGPGVKTVDLVEFFNFLYGLHLERMET